MYHRTDLVYVYDGTFDGLLNHADKRDFEDIIAKMYEEWQPEEA